MALRLLAIAATHSRLGYAFFIGERLVDWRISDRAAKSAAKAAAWARSVIADLRPDVVVTETPAETKRKGEKTKAMIDAVAAVAADAPILDVSVPRAQGYENKYQEADAIANVYPELRPWVPKPRQFFENEPRSIVIFEAMTLAFSILRIRPKVSRRRWDKQSPSVPCRSV
ncbi:MAG: hypothetical protein IPL47_17555 [Phyllobacteriaceae bacterium]|nr:hypothetical protein [Phyllobacteriaceae bacterium]